jgi:hypothetical protein
LKPQCQPENVRFSRFIMTVMITIYALFGLIESMYIMIAFTVSTILLSSRFSFSTTILKLLNRIKFDKIFKLNPRYQQSFMINREMELFEESLRLFVSAVVVLLYHLDFTIASTVVAFFMATMMLISSFFGFCISGLFFIAFKALKAKIKND